MLKASMLNLTHTLVDSKRKLMCKAADAVSGSAAAAAAYQPRHDTHAADKL